MDGSEYMPIPLVAVRTGRGPATRGLLSLTESTSINAATTIPTAPSTSILNLFSLRVILTYWFTWVLSAVSTRGAPLPSSFTLRSLQSTTCGLWMGRWSLLGWGLFQELRYIYI